VTHEAAEEGATPVLGTWPLSILHRSRMSPCRRGRRSVSIPSHCHLLDQILFKSQLTFEADPSPPLSHALCNTSSVTCRPSSRKRRIFSAVTPVTIETSELSVSMLTFALALVPRSKSPFGPTDRKEVAWIGHSRLVLAQRLFQLKHSAIRG
jgi:hypothetical protein